MTVRSFARRAMVLLVAGYVPSSAPVQPVAEVSTPAEMTAEPAGPPNVLIVVTDDQRAGGTLGVMPRTRGWFGSGGTRFTNAFATTPLCCPSRASIFTGRYTHNHGVLVGARRSDLDQDTTVQRALSEAGYRTAIFGKYLNGWDIQQPPPHFDRWTIFSKGFPDGYSGGTWNADGNVRTIDRYSTHYIRNRALGFLEGSESKDDRPWFMYLAPFAPHAPFTPAAEHRTAPIPKFSPSGAYLEPDRSDKPGYVQDASVTHRKVVATRRGQLRTLMSVDAVVDDVMRRLAELGETNTLAFFLSDNGYLWGEHRLDGKTAPYTESVKIPLMMRWPGHVPAGEVDGRLAATIDLAPTIMQATGLALDEPMDGRSLLDAGGRARLLLEYWDSGIATTPTWASIRTRSAQYIEYYDRSGATLEDRELYDLRRDPRQAHNLATSIGRSPDMGGLADQLHEDRACRGTDGPDACP